MNTENLASSERQGESARFIIVNADDFGYYDCVSKGILNCADAGAVTATGILANSPYLEEHLKWLRRSDGVDIGVHLNLTDREALTPALRAQLRRWNGCFPGKFAMTRRILAGQLSLDDLAQELRAQIYRCRSAGADIRFLNSHEHIHMLPPLFRITQDLAIEYGIPHVRYPLPDAFGSLAPGPLIRDVSLRFLGVRNRQLLQIPVLPFLGMSASGKLNMAYLRRVLSGLASGVYELMCHPGDCDYREVSNPALRSYHDWNGELNVLTGGEFRDLCKSEHIELIGYRHTEIVNGAIRLERGDERKPVAVRDVRN